MDSILTVSNPINFSPLQGKSREVIVPKPGEFFVVNTSSNTTYNRKMIQAASFQKLPEGASSRQEGLSKDPKTSNQFVEHALNKQGSRFKLETINRKE